MEILFPLGITSYQDAIPSSKVGSIDDEDYGARRVYLGRELVCIEKGANRLGIALVLLA